MLVKIAGEHQVSVTATKSKEDEKVKTKTILSLLTRLREFQRQSRVVAPSYCGWLLVEDGRSDKAEGYVGSEADIDLGGELISTDTMSFYETTEPVHAIPENPCHKKN